MIPSVAYRHKGLDGSVFGSSISEVLQSLGSDLDWTILRSGKEDGGEVNIEVPDHARFSFSPESCYKLDGIEIMSSSIAFEGLSIIGVSVQDVMSNENLPGIYMEDEFVDDDDNLLQWLEVKTFSLLVYAHNGRVKSFSIYPDYDEDEKPVWPDCS